MSSVPISFLIVINIKSMILYVYTSGSEGLFITSETTVLCSYLELGRVDFYGGQMTSREAFPYLGTSQSSIL